MKECNNCVVGTPKVGDVFYMRGYPDNIYYSFGRRKRARRIMLLSHYRETWRVQEWMPKGDQWHIIGPEHEPL
jgi:hypothetical protein